MSGEVVAKDADVREAAAPFARVLDGLRTPEAAAAARALFGLLAACLFGVIGWRLLRRITWYISAWQFGYLTFAQDLAHGAVLHHSPLLDALRDVLPPRTDVLVQSYVWDHGRMYCRFAPGFPICSPPSSASSETTPFTM